MKQKHENLCPELHTCRMENAAYKSPMKDFCRFRKRTHLAILNTFSAQIIRKSCALRKIVFKTGKEKTDSSPSPFLSLTIVENRLCFLSSVFNIKGEVMNPVFIYSTAILFVMLMDPFGNLPVFVATCKEDHARCGENGGQFGGPAYFTGSNHRIGCSCRKSPLRRATGIPGAVCRCCGPTR